MYFRLAGGYIGISPLAPPDYARWPIMTALYEVAGVPDAGDQLKALLAHEQVGAIIVSPLKYRFVDQFEGHGTSATWLHAAHAARKRRAPRSAFHPRGGAARGRRGDALSDCTRAARAVPGCHGA